jgi:hypothetical protein
MTNKIGLWNIPLIHSNTREYAMVVLSRNQLTFDQIMLFINNPRG